MTTAVRPLPKHGTQTRYKGARNGSYPPCRCAACTRAHTLGCKRRALAHLAGQPPLYPGEPLREHIQTLLNSGMSRDLIARRANVSHATISYLIRGLTKSCRRDKALRILAVTPGQFDQDAERPVLGSMRRIRALYFMGHNHQTIAAAAGITASNVSHIANGHNEIVQGTTAAAIAAAYRTLSAKQGTSDKARSRARSLGWDGPLAWDTHTIDDPNALPDRDGVGTAQARRRDMDRPAEIRHLAGFGLSADTIAKQVGLDVKDVKTRLAKLQTDAAAARRQLQTLAAEGYPVPWLATAVGMSPSGLAAIQNGHTTCTSTETARAIDSTYRTLHGTDPATHGIPRGSISLTLLTAGRNGWTTTRKDNP